MKNLFSIHWFAKIYDTSELYIHWIGLKKYISKEFIKHYQNECRFYLDEYDGQEELRKEWFDTVVYRHNYEIDEIVNNFCYFESDQIFNNRWIKRG